MCYGLVGLNAYDPCMANRITESEKQHTVVWHVDVLHATHVDPVENTKLIDYLRGIYGDKMTINRGKKYFVPYSDPRSSSRCR